MKYACVFPGQGSQSVGMLNELAQAFPIVTDTFQQASDQLGYDLWALVQNGPAETLNQTQYTQPAMLTAGVAVYRVWQQTTDSQPSVVAGHSLGEYSALVAANAISFSDAVNLVHQRATLMADTMPAGQGAMAAIVGLDDQAVQALCDEAAQGEVLAPANFNSIGQTVIAGHTSAVERAVEMASDKGAKLAKIIPVSVPCHCDLLLPAADAFEQALQHTTFNPPHCPVIRNIDVQPHHVDQMVESLKSQLYRPVRWVETIQAIAGQGIDLIIEMGPGRVLTGLTKRIDRQLTAKAIYDPDTLQQAKE